MAEKSANSQNQDDKTQLISRRAWQKEVAVGKMHGLRESQGILEPLHISAAQDISIAMAYDALQKVLEDEKKQGDPKAVQISERIENGSKVNKRDYPIEENPFLSQDSVDMSVLADHREVFFEDPEVAMYLKSRESELNAAHQWLKEVWPEFSRMYTAGVQRGIYDEYIPAYAKKRLEKALVVPHVRVVDGALLSKADERIHTSGVYNHVTDEVWINHESRLDKIGILTLAHEFVHKISGGTFVKGYDDKGFRVRLGYVTETYDKSVILRDMLDEGVVHHVTLGVLTGDFETVDPDDRQGINSLGNRQYRHARKVIGTSIKRSKGLLTARLFTNALFEDTGPGGGFQLRKNLIRAAQAAYGPGAMKKIGLLCDYAETADPEQLEEMLSRIVSPVVDMHGRVLERGYIDIEGIPASNESYKLADYL